MLTTISPREKLCPRCFHTWHIRGSPCPVLDCYCAPCYVCGRQEVMDGRVEPGGLVIFMCRSCLRKSKGLIVPS